ncbi:macrophage mannose receptor 1-like [Sardina pilchardus]|uniref:macrophage mannose receptor 1-like n=1 Tax=Sardina pilchardus TaxID=27697 RepID=UPI002E0EDF53
MADKEANLYQGHTLLQRTLKFISSIMTLVGTHVVLLAELWTLSSALLHQYHFVNESKTWQDAQKYCKITYKDLATVTTLEEMNQIINIAKSNSFKEKAWIGLYNDVNSWRWSSKDTDSYDQSELMFTRWESGQPDNYQGKQTCAKINSAGQWDDINCEMLRVFICYDQGTADFVFINSTSTWSNAQHYCREHRTDLASVRNKNENERVKNLVPSGNDAWIGLFRDAWKWSDGNNSSYRYWNDNEPNNNWKRKENCGDFWMSANGKWNDENCSILRPFFCYTGPKVRRQIVSVEFQVNSMLDVTDTEVQDGILRQIKKKLQENGLPADAKLSWRKQSDGQIFHEKKDEKREDAKRKRGREDEF